MFYACDVMVSSFISVVLCCEPSRACMYFVLFLLIFIVCICDVFCLGALVLPFNVN
jgi:hypothetical protein